MGGLARSRMWRLCLGSWLVTLLSGSMARLFELMVAMCELDFSCKDVFCVLWWFWGLNLSL